MKNALEGASIVERVVAVGRVTRIRGWGKLGDVSYLSQSSVAPMNNPSSKVYRKRERE